MFDAASWNGIAIDSTCGGHGTCRKCKVRVASGDVPIDAVDPRAFSPDELRDGWRLACRAMAAGDLEIDVPPLQTRPKAALVGVGRHVILRPSVQKRHVTLEEPSLEDQVVGPRAHRGAPSTTSRSSSTRPSRGRSAAPCGSRTSTSRSSSATSS